MSFQYVFLLMKADFSEVPEGNAWHRGLVYIQILEILYDVINPCCGIWWQIVPANYQHRKIFMAIMKERYLILEVPFRNAKYDFVWMNR